MATYVLIHGAWYGGWCWQRVTRLLRDAGHEVVTPALTGLGERAHLLNLDIDLSTRIADVFGVPWYEDLTDVVLVGHSYGGMVVTGVAAAAPERLAHLVYLDAFVPRAGQALVDLLPPERWARFLEQSAAGGEGWTIPPVPVEVFGVTDEADRAWAVPRIVPHPLKTFTQAAPAAREGADAPPRTYILCAGYAGSFAPFAERARTEPGWRYRELASGHNAMITAPRELANLLLEVAPAPVAAGHSLA